jgi:hypothetical protein
VPLADSSRSVNARSAHEWPFDEEISFVHLIDEEFPGWSIVNVSGLNETSFQATIRPLTVIVLTEQVAECSVVSIVHPVRIT